MTSELRRTIQSRAQGCCEYCRAQEKYSHDPFSAEHIIPISKGGKDISENLAWSCFGCNLHKYTATEGLDIVTGVLATLFHPRLERWDDHFRWDSSFTIIIGLSPTGRATINRLKLNRPGLVNLRAVLESCGKHPPE